MEQFKGTVGNNEEWKQEQRNLAKKVAATDKQLQKLLIFNHTTQLKQRIDRLYEQSQTNTIERAEEEAAVMGRLGSIRSGVSELKQLLKFYEKKNEYLVKVQKLSEGIVVNMEGFKEEMAAKYNECAEAEDELTRELEIMEAKVDQYESGEVKEEFAAIPSIISRPEKGKENKTVNRQQSMPEVTHHQQAEDPVQAKLHKIEQSLQQKTIEMDALEKAVAILGRNYGWPEDDHNDFLLIWSKRRGNYFELEQECLKHLRMYTTEQIHTHIDKHRKWLELQQSKKELLSEYRLMKQQKRSLEMKLVERQDAIQEEQLNRQRRLGDAEKEEKERKEKLLQWRLMKQAKKEAEELKQREQEARKKEQQRLKRKEFEQKRIAYEQWKRQEQSRKVEQMKQQQQQQRPVRPQSAAQRQTMEKIRQRQDDLLRKKMDALRAKQEQQRQRIKVYPFVMQREQELKQRKQIKYSHVNSKLEQKTTAIKQKQRSKYDGTNPKDASTFGGIIGTGMGRAVPSWRQGL